MNETARRPATGLTIIMVLLLLASSAFADIEGPKEPMKYGIGGQRSGGPADLIEPIKAMLSGRAWMIAEGIDPGLRQRPEWDTLTKLDWRSLDQIMASSPSLQAAGGFFVPFRSPAPAFSRDVLISRDFSNTPIQTEPHLAVNPDDPDHIVVGMIDYNFPSNTSYVTYDGGASWEGPFQAGYLPDDMVSGGDPVMGFDREGNLYMASISIGVEEFSIGPVYSSSMMSDSERTRMGVP